MLDDAGRIQTESRNELDARWREVLDDFRDAPRDERLTVEDVEVVARGIIRDLSFAAKLSIQSRRRSARA